MSLDLLSAFPLAPALSHRPTRPLFQALCVWLEELEAGQQGVARVNAAVEELVATWPVTVRQAEYAEVNYTPNPPHWLAGHDAPPWWGLLRSVELYDEFVTVPSYLPPMAPQVLRLGLHRPPPEHLPELLRRFPNAASLGVSDFELQAAGVEALFQVGRPWHEVSLCDAQLDDESLLAFVKRAPHSIERLDLGWNPDLTAMSMQALGGWIQRARPRRLRLSHTGVGAEGVAALIDAGGLDSLIELDLSGLDLFMEQVGVLGALPTEQLRKLNLSANHLLDEGLTCLLAMPWPHLEELILDGVRVGQEGLEALLESTDLGELRTLGLSSAFDVEGVELARVSSDGPWKRLQALSLENSRLGDRGLVRLLCGYDLRLELLNLRACKITDFGLCRLVESDCFQRLKGLDLRENDLTEEGLRVLLDATADRPEFEGYVDLEPLAPSLRAEVVERWPEVESGEPLLLSSEEGQWGRLPRC